MPAAEPPPIETLDRDDLSGRLTLLARLPDAAPFPFDAPGFFTEGVAGARRRSVAGNTYDEDRYRDDRVLVHRPAGFDPARPCAILLYLHGHGTLLSRDVAGGHAIPAQLDRAGVNALLVAPQMAREAADSHSGKLSHPGGAARLLDEAAAAAGLDRARLATSPVIVAAFSGGYRAAADCLTVGGLGDRIAGCVLIDALYARLDDFVAWRAAASPSSFLAVLHGPSTRDLALALGRRLRETGETVHRRWPLQLAPGTVAIAPSRIAHPDMPVLGPPRFPLTQVLRRAGLRRITP